MSHGYTLDWNVALRALNTFRVDAQARCVARVRDAAALPALFGNAAVRGLPALVLGEGSNVLFAAPRFEGLIVHLEFAEVRVLDRDDATHARVLVEAAHSWDPFVDWTLDQGLAGLENLALIPGQVGAAPIQNIGAYGVEVSECVTAVHAYDRVHATFVRLTGDACAFGYRDSLFKRDPGRHVVTAVEFRLARDGVPRLDYAGVREELGDAAPTPRNIANAVRRVRRRKLPDPAVVGNAGSFFKNPIVPVAVAETLAAVHPAMPTYPTGRVDERKLSAAWLIEQSGWRGRRDGDAGMSAQHALVLANLGHATGAQLLSLARRVAADVEQRFGVRLEPEPRVVGTEP